MSQPENENKTNETADLSDRGGIDFTPADGLPNLGDVVGENLEAKSEGLEELATDDDEVFVPSYLGPPRERIAASSLCKKLRGKRTHDDWKAFAPDHQ